MKLLPLGGAREIGASCFLLEIGGRRLLLDAGLRPGIAGPGALPDLDRVEEQPDALLLSHAHHDHLGALPVVAARWPAMPVYATPATARLALPMLEDAVRVMEHQGFPLFSLAEAADAVARIRPVPFHREVTVAPGVAAVFRPAGHILGAASALLRAEQESCLYSGDISTAAGFTTPPAYLPPSPEPVQLVVCEATYGDTLLPSRKAEVQALVGTIREVLAGGGRVLIPSFALGRAQEVLLILLHHMHSGLLPRVPVYLDGMVRAITRAFADMPEELPQSLRNYLRTARHNPFLSPPVHLVEDAREREEVAGRPEPMVVLASSGMLSGGPSPYYARRILQEPASALLLVGYQDEESPGHRLLTLQTGQTLQLGDAEIPVAATVARYRLSAHADRAGIAAFLSRYPAPEVTLVHGEPAAIEALRSALHSRTRIVRTAAVGEELDYTVPPAWLVPSLPLPSSPSPRPVVKLRRFRTEVSVHAPTPRTVILRFPEEVDAQSLFPEGTYRLEVHHGARARMQLRSRFVLGEQSQEEAAADPPEGSGTEAPVPRQGVPG